MVFITTGPGLSVHLTSYHKSPLSHKLKLVLQVCRQKQVIQSLYIFVWLSHLPTRWMFVCANDAFPWDWGWKNTQALAFSLTTMWSNAAHEAYIYTKHAVPLALSRQSIFSLYFNSLSFSRKNPNLLRSPPCRFAEHCVGSPPGVLRPFFYS